MPTAWPSMKPTSPRPSWRMLGPPQLASSEATVPPPNQPTSSSNQTSVFSGDVRVTQSAASVVSLAFVPESVM